MVFSSHIPKCGWCIVSTIADAEAGAALFPMFVVEIQHPPSGRRVGGFGSSLEVFPGGIIADEALASGRDGQEKQPAQCQSFEWHGAECRNRLAGVNVVFLAK